MLGKQVGFYLDAEACNGCSVCLVACKDKYDNPVGVNFRKVIHETLGHWEEDRDNPGFMIPRISAYSLSIACNHCETPVCQEACPVAAITKREEDGRVLIDPEVCVGCRLCQCCPYDAPQFNHDLGIMTMCDGCVDLESTGEEQACVAACPQRALEFGDMEELQKKHAGAVKGGVEPLVDPAITQPSLLVTPHRHSKPKGDVSVQEKSSNREEEATDAF